MSRVGTYRALKGQRRLEAVQRAPNTQVHPASERHGGPTLSPGRNELYGQGAIGGELASRG